MSAGFLLRIGEVAARLAVSRATVYRLIEDGELPAIRVRGHLRIEEAELLSFLDRRREAARAAAVSVHQGDEPCSRV